MSADRSGDAPLDPVAERVADVRFGAGSTRPPRRSRASGSSSGASASFRQVRRNRKRFTLGVAFASAFIVVGLAGSRFRNRAPTPAPLSYRVDNRDPPAGGYILASQTGGCAAGVFGWVEGQDGSARAWPRRRSRAIAGAKFVLDDGKVSVDIVHRPRAQWIFEAGPFRVNVHGTSFTVAWNPVEAVFEVRLASGSISVASPVAGPEIQMRAGQTLRVSLRDQSSTLAATSRQEGPAPAGGPAPSASLAPLPSAPTPSGPSESPRWSHRGWMAALSENGAADVIADADRRGLRTAIERADSEDLWALANAARYAGRYSLASQALNAHRRRFPSSERSREAAFLLGRLHDGDPSGPGDALGWYDRYLVEAHDGVGVSDALGRKMTLLQRWNRRAEALTVARDYLRRFPRGTYANAARALVRSSIAEQ